MKSLTKIAELSCNHAGKKRNLKKLIDNAAHAGFTHIKVSLDNPDGGITINSNKPDFMLRDGLWKGQNLYQLYKKTRMPWDWLWTAKAKADIYNIGLIVAVSCLDGLAFCQRAGVETYKISSFENQDIPLCRAIWETGKQVIISTGCGNDAYGVFWDQAKYLYCVSKYPTEDNDISLPLFGDEYQGISYHGKNSDIILAAVARGAEIFEVHFKLDCVESEDSLFSWTMDEACDMIKRVDMMWRIIHRGKDKKLDTSLCKSIYAIQDIKKSDIFTADNIGVIRPGYGLHPWYYSRLLGKTAAVDLEKGDRITEDML